MPVLSVQKTAKVPQLQRSFKVADVPVVQVVMVPQVLSAVVNVPVIIQQLVCQFSDLLVYWGTDAVMVSI